ncbi:MAG: zinc ribbon domain-containing protein [Chloroflexi bacterium]|nr:zinc ribbon domain-containing protein [Chloroflexota bacterium]
MPLYEYVCTVCDHEFEKLRPMSKRDDSAPCPKCDGESERQLSVFAAFSSGSNGQMSAVAGAGGGCCGGGGGACACAMGA